MLRGLTSSTTERDVSADLLEFYCLRFDVHLIVNTQTILTYVLFAIRRLEGGLDLLTLYRRMMLNSLCEIAR